MRKSGHDELVGRTIAGKFAIDSFLGSGAMGAVYRARQLSLDKVVAIKVLHVEHADDATFAARFQREAKAASRLNHPNSMAVIDYGEEPDGLLYIAMEYLDGKNLHKIIQEEWPIAEARVVDILMQTLAALAVAHDMGVVHRDLKPENIMVLRTTNDDGEASDLVKVCDFGIAKITDSRGYKSLSGDPAGNRASNAPVTTAGFLVGTPEYMSPEQGKGEKLDARSDLYSIGVILYQLLTGSVPFDAENAIGVVLKHITEEPQRPSLRNPACDRRLEGVCLRAMKKPREERFQSAREMRAELRGVLDRSRPTPISELPSVRVLAASPLPAHSMEVAATLAALDGRNVHTAKASSEKMTLAGTEAEVPGLPSRRRRAFVVGGFLGVVGLVIAAIYVVPYMRAPPPLAPDDDREFAAALHEGPSGVDPPSGTGTAPSAVPPLTPRPLATKATKATTSVGPQASVPSASVPVVASTAAPSATVSAPIVAVVPTPAETTPPPPPEAYDASRAYAAVGIVNAQGAKEGSVRGAVRGINFTGCYRTALAGRPRATGYATLNLSIDENGTVRGAVATGANFLPGLARCIQSAAYGIHIPKAAMEAASATAEVNVEFKAPL